MDNQETMQLERYSRQMLFAPIGEKGQQKLLQSTVSIIGMGALGTVLANHLVRAGVGRVRLIDRDFVESSNLQRQMLYDELDVAAMKPKVIAAKDKLQLINSSVAIEAMIADATASNIEELLEGADLALDGTDNLETRFLLNDACFKKGIPFIYGGAVSSRGMSGVFIPGETPCLRCLIQHSDTGGQTCDVIGVLGPIVDLVASYQAIEALKLLVGAREQVRSELLSFDAWHNQHRVMGMGKPRQACPTCVQQQYPSLTNVAERGAISLCGRETIQITAGRQLDLAVLKERLEPAVTSIRLNPYLLRAELPGDAGERLVIFADGRVLVQGTEEIARARTLYARYIGG